MAVMIRILDDNDVVSKASVQNDTKKTRSDVNPNFLSTIEVSRLPSTVVGPSGKRTYLTPN